MNKPLKDWTLGEIQEKCAGTGPDYCTGCPFDGGSVCNVNGLPYQWNLATPPRFTEQEISDAKTLLRAFPDYTQVERDGSDLYLEIGDNAPHILILDFGMFPSVKDGHTVKLSEIITEGGADHDKN